ncbi:cell envelope integrity EipB family protein [Methylobrevis pamukkalensis]|uniref:ATP-binding protein n=1 Tax=Methylobrevis pamukkalensis TaxID=1439726 RepID=A0A1E3H132_9HYPH|nr:cell envelope integrity EipB family protein [Methylobrevis pamukkalensis]ODN70010.1 hypothetical protein A6302_02666 [Methylobrevis pamukkalensis]
MTKTATWGGLATTSLATALCAVTAFPAWSATLLPHRVAYDLAMINTDAGSGVSDVSGRMVMEFTGSRCEGYTTNFRFVMKVQDDDAKAVITDLRTSTFETAEGDGFDFLSQTYTDQVLSEEVKGRATRSDDGVEVALLSPEKRTIPVAPKSVFPTANLTDMLAAAARGEGVLQAMVFDGSEGADKSYATTAIIGPPKTGAANAVAAELSGMTFWQMNVSYFDPEKSGDTSPEYSMSFDLYENGVADRLTLDYGELQLSGAMKTFEALPLSDCK